MGKATKATKKFNKKHLTKELKQRRQNKQIKAKFEKRRGNKGGAKSEQASSAEQDDSEFGYQAIAGANEEELNDDILNSLEQAEDSEFEEEASDDEKAVSDAMEEDSSSDEELDYKKIAEAIQENDPEHYKFLQKNDPDLLKAESSEDEEELEEDLEEDVPSKAKKAERVVDGVLSMAQVTEWEQGIEKNHCSKALRQLVLAFEAGAHIGDEEFVSRSPFEISGDKIFNKLMVTCLRQVPVALDHHLVNKSSPAEKPNQSPKWNTFRPIARSFLSAILYMFSITPTDDMLKYLLESTNSVIRYLACDEKMARLFLKVLLDKFSNAGQPKLQTASFALIRKLAVLCPATLDRALRGVYEVFVRNARKFNTHTVTRITIIRSCAAELFGHDFDKSYQLAFTCIRQLAIHLRSCLTNKTKESYSKVYNWQFIQSINFWAHVLATYCDRDVVEAHGESPLQPLIYPLTQVALGAISLIPSPKYFPLRFQCIRALTLIARKTQTYIPTIPYIIEVLESIEFQRQPAPSTLKPFNIAVTLKAPTNFLRTRVYQDILTDEVNELLLGYFASFSSNIGFPEVALPTIIYLKKFIKTSKSVKVNKKIEQIIAKVSATSDMILAKRSKLTFAPTDIASMSAFVSTDKDIKIPVLEYYESVLAFKTQRQVVITGAAESD
ncbi:Nucleolar Complex 2 protein [Entomophthora muscae]|uniref:Nucleolar Complex 2 protein n=1 Tax=Entomophthora muscae TaxID=34485 RepID=A0ACC2T629_9FUNG|nr:Nucleolar Complex 2 protein [Entomophthora muscae]